MFAHVILTILLIAGIVYALWKLFGKPAIDKIPDDINELREMLQALEKRAVELVEARRLASCLSDLERVTTDLSDVNVQIGGLRAALLKAEAGIRKDDNSPEAEEETHE